MMLNNNSNKIRSFTKKQPLMLQTPGGKKGRPSLLHNGINGQKGGKNAKGTAAKPGKMKGVDHVSLAVNALKKKRR